MTETDGENKTEVAGQCVPCTYLCLPINLELNLQCLCSISRYKSDVCPMAKLLSKLPNEILSKVLQNRQERNLLLVISSKRVV
jgi:hypothetical protein